MPAIDRSVSKHDDYVDFKGFTVYEPQSIMDMYATQVDGLRVKIEDSFETRHHHIIVDSLEIVYNEVFKTCLETTDWKQTLQEAFSISIMRCQPKMTEWLIKINDKHKLGFEFAKDLADLKTQKGFQQWRSMLEYDRPSVNKGYVEMCQKRFDKFYKKPQDYLTIDIPEENPIVDKKYSLAHFMAEKQKAKVEYLIPLFTALKH